MHKLSTLQTGTLGDLLAVAKVNTLWFAAYLSPEGAPSHGLTIFASGNPKYI